VDRPLVVPVDTKVRLLVTGADVVHSWWVPKFGVKKDAIPGFINETWFTATEVGTYRGQCAELCGMDHGFMPIVVQVLGKADYEAWITSQRALQSSLTGVSHQ
jgi:cytochrome c oxidase subunit II